MSGRAATINVIPGSYALSVGKTDMPAPPGWQWLPLTNVARLESGHTPSREHSEYWNGEFPWIGIKDARTYHGSGISETFQTVTQAGLDNSAARLLPIGTVCLSRTASVGYVVVTERVMATSQDFVNWVCGPALDPHFLKQLLIAENESLFKFGKGSTHTTIYYPEVKAFHACLPPVAEQRRIVTKLEALQTRSRRAREALDAVPPLLEKLRQSILAAAFRGDLTKDWRAKQKDLEPATELLKRIRTARRQKWESTELAKLKSKGKPPTDDQWKLRYEEADPASKDSAELPRGWCWATVGELTYESTYGTSSKSVDGQEGVPILGMSNIREGELVFGNLKTLPADHDEFPALLLRSGDLLFNRTNSPELVGKTAVFRGEGPCSFASYLIRLRTAYVEPDLIAFFLNSPFGRSWVGSVVSQQVGQANVNGTKLAALAIPVPPAAEQALLIARVARVLAAVRQFHGTTLASLDRVAVLDRATLAKAFRGELVPQDPNDEPAEAMLARARSAIASTPADGTPKKRGRPRSPRADQPND